MCGAPKVQEVVTRTELDPNLQRMLYGGVFPGAPAASEVGIAGVAPNPAVGQSRDSGRDRSPFNAVQARTPAQQAQAESNLRNVRAALGMARSDSPMEVGGLYAMGGVVTPQQGLASLNQGQMPMMNGQLPNLSDPMTAATLAMALRSPQMQYGSIAGNPMMQTNFNVGGYVEGPGTGTSDSIDSVIMQNGRPVQQAKLSDGEFVMTERAVKGAGNGDREAGAARMYELMQKFERGGRV
jgi:hypothetical protein